MNDINQKVSIILYVYNAQDTLAACLDSLLEQTYSDLQIIAIDDNSKDKSHNILHVYKKLDKRIKVFRNVKTYGKSITLNRGINHINGKYVIFMSTSDTITKDKVRKQLQFLEEHAKVVAVGTQCAYLNEQRRRIGKSYFPTETHVISRTLFTGFALHSESVMINRFRLPKDFLHFLPVPNKRFSFTPLFIKLLRYGTIANFDQQLQYHVKQEDIFSLQSELISYIKLWLRARFVYDLRLPLLTLFYPLVR